MTRYWIAVASQEHVQRAITGGFAQVCHGKCGPLKQMKDGDWLIYYSPTLHFGDNDPCRSFTAIGKVNCDPPYQFEMTKEFIPWRRNVNFKLSKVVPIKPLIDQLQFIKDKKRWGFPFRRGCFNISVEDFQVIAETMGIEWQNI